MTDPGQPQYPVPGTLGKIEILDYLSEVADELGHRGLSARLVVVGGGSYLQQIADLASGS
ncbi:hypothetical protein [Streptomyces sp. SID13031]|uniref:hypothetical protein n=1 Tax=Streptomyces sp. SID13031 TaxID=2706046 RepID=UPI0013CD510D|nr:hypothetical protein [Streptomyces sp. SID13031]NEA36263.1 hypothetical protein [Streptomyces sp. SID13031]